MAELAIDRLPDLSRVPEDRRIFVLARPQNGEQLINASLEYAMIAQISKPATDRVAQSKLDPRRRLAEPVVNLRIGRIGNQPSRAPSKRRSKRWKSRRCSRSSNPKFEPKLGSTTPGGSGFIYIC